MRTAPGPVPKPTPVINFVAQPGTATSSETRPREEYEPHPDGEIISMCIECAVRIHGLDLAYKIDPTDSEYSGALYDRYKVYVGRALRRMTKMPAKTLAGLRAKATLAPMLFAQVWDDDDVGIAEIPFIQSIADDLKLLCQDGASFSDTPLVEILGGRE